MKTLCPLDSPTLGESLQQKDKMVRMAGIMKACARATITLAEDGSVREISEIPDFAARGNYIVVVGPSKKYNNQEVIRLEIGLSRSTPYMQFEWKENEKKKAVKGRKHIPLTATELIQLLPVISKILQKLIDEKVARWDSLSKKTMSNGVVTTWWRGCFVTASLNDELLLYALLLLDRKLRDQTFLRSLADRIYGLLKNHKKVTYTKKELQVQKSARLIRERFHNVYTQEQVETVLKYLGKPGSKIRYLFEGVILTLGIKPRVKLESYEEEFLKLQRKFSHLDGEIRKAFQLQVATHPKRDDARNHHAKGCMRIEVLPSKEARTVHEQRVRYLEPKVEEEDAELIPF